MLSGSMREEEQENLQYQVVQQAFECTTPAAAAGEVELDAIFTGPDGRQRRIPGYWDGASRWGLRFCPEAPGRYEFTTICSAPEDGGLHGRGGCFEVAPAGSENPLHRHGPVRCAGRGFVHADGAPFRWLGDTWWMALCGRLAPEQLAVLVTDRAAKGFTLVQLVAGLFPDMPPFDPRGANGGTWAWQNRFAGPDPRFFQLADQRIEAIVSAGLAPCIFGAWGYYLPWMGVRRMKQHWRYLLARYSAYPVIWSLAGETGMPYYLIPPDQRAWVVDRQQRGWSEVAKYVKETDGHCRPMSTQPGGRSQRSSEDLPEAQNLLDFEMVGGYHGPYPYALRTIADLKQIVSQVPDRPVVLAESCYEALRGADDASQRVMFWGTILSGAAGFTYGANGIWQVNQPDEPFGNSPQGSTWGNIPWQQAYRLPGSGQLGRALDLLRRNGWHEVRPLRIKNELERVSWPGGRLRLYGGRFSDGTLVFYLPSPGRGIAGWMRRVQWAGLLRDLSKVVRRELAGREREEHALWLDPASGEQQTASLACGKGRRLRLRPPVVGRDWVVVVRGARLALEP